MRNKLLLIAVLLGGLSSLWAQENKLMNAGFEEVTVKTGDNKVYMKQTILIMSASVCILYATWKRKKRRH